MTDDLLLAAVDERGDRAGVARRALAAELPVPVFDPDLVDLRVAPDGRRRRWVALAGAAAIVLLVAAAAVLARRGDDDSAPAVDVDLGVRPAAYVLDRPPAGLDLASLSEPRIGPDPVRGGPGPGPQGLTTVLYGAEADGPPGLAAVAVQAWAGGGTTPGPAGGGPVPTEAAGLEPVDVVGRNRAWATPASDPGPPSVLVPVGDGFVQLYRAGAPGSAATVDDVLLAAAGAVAVDDERATIEASGLPAGWVEQGDVTTSDVLDGPIDGGGLRTPGVGWGTVHGTVPDADSGLPVAEDDDPRGLVVSVASGDALDVQARRFGAAAHVEVRVRGHLAVLVARPSEAERPWAELSLSWLEAPGVVIDVVGIGIDRRELLALAERLRPATSDEIDQARGTVLDAQLAEAEEERVVVGRGRFSDGREWGL
ncbi:MAG TPA: hypothetical protein VK507_17765, partial [Iamia sp.]|nr:hypothetical protein [Iamia sp.]